MADQTSQDAVSEHFMQPASVPRIVEETSAQPPAGSPAVVESSAGSNDSQEISADGDVPVPPPRKQSQFRDALASLERERSIKLAPVTPQRTERDLNSSEKAAVASTRRVWAATIEQRKDPHDNKVAHSLRPSRDLDDEERKRVAATRNVWKSDTLSAGNRQSSKSVDETTLSSRDLTADEKARVSKLRNVWKRVEGGEQSDSPSMDGVKYWSTAKHSSHPSRQLSDDEKRRVAETREHWLRADPWKSLFESSAPIENRGLSPEEISRIAALRLQWKKLTDDEKAVQIAAFKRQFKNRSIPEMAEASDVDLDVAQASHEMEHQDLDSGDVELTTIHVTPVDTATSLHTVNSMLFDDTTALHHPDQLGHVDDRELTRRECKPEATRHQPMPPSQLGCCCVIM